MNQTDLTVVNSLLKVIGESPVNQVLDSHPDVVIALNIWDEYSSEIQSIGWWYNTETWELSPDTSGYVVLPPKTISILGSNTNYIKKGKYLYDLENHTYDFSDAASSDLELTLITEWNTEDLPPVIFNYILAKCKLSMLVDLAYDANKEKRLEREVDLRYFLVQKNQLRFGKPNATSTATASDLLNKQPTR